MKPKKFVANMIIILSMLALAGLASCSPDFEVGVVESQAANDEEQAPIEFGIEPTPTPENMAYTNDFYGFRFKYPETWTLTEADHSVVLMKGSSRLGINFRWVNEVVAPVRSGMAAGTPIYSGKFRFMEQTFPESIVTLDNLTKYVLYNDTSPIEIEELVFNIVLEDLESDYMTLDIPETVIVEARTILESFVRIPAAGSPPEEVIPAPETAGEPQTQIPVVAWLGHIASLPEGSQFDDMVVLSPEGTGEFGLQGATPEIETEIETLRDAEGPNEYAFLWGGLACDVNDYNNCQLTVERLQYGANYAEQEVVDWFGTIKQATFNGGDSYVFELLGPYPMWYSINASQDEALRDRIGHFLGTGEVVEVSGLLMVGVPDVNGTRIEITSIEVRSETGMPRPDITDGLVYENQSYGFTFEYPSQMSVEEAPNQVLVNHGSLQMTISYRRADEDITIVETGELTGQFHPYNELFFLEQAVQPLLKINDGRITAVYLGGPAVELVEGTPLRFAVSLVNTDGTWLSNAQVDEMLAVFQKFALLGEAD